MSIVILTLVLECSSDSLNHRVLDIGTLVDNMEILAPSLTHNARVTLVHIQIVRDILPEFFEYMS